MGRMHLQPGMIIQVFKTEGNCNAVDAVNLFLGALPRQTSMLKHESTRTIGMFHGMPYPNQPRIQFHLPLVAPLHHWQRLFADSSASFSASRPTFGYEGLQVPRLDSKVFLILSLGSGLQHLKFEEIQS